MGARSRFTHLDPFVDTERPPESAWVVGALEVSPTSIRLWILKDRVEWQARLSGLVSPTSIRLWILKGCATAHPARPANSFTHLDPFVDTERALVIGIVLVLITVSPTSIRLWILKGQKNKWQRLAWTCFTHLDPFVDTESKNSAGDSRRGGWFHPPRSVCGY